MPPDELHCVSLLTGYMINGDFMGHSRLYPSKPTPRALPSNLKRNLDRQADYHGKVRDLYDLAVEIVKNRGEFDNPTETQTSKIAGLARAHKLQLPPPPPATYPLSNYPEKAAPSRPGRRPKAGKPDDIPF